MQIGINHAIDGEMPFYMATTIFAIDLINTSNHLDSLNHVVD